MSTMSSAYARTLQIMLSSGFLLSRRSISKSLIKTLKFVGEIGSRCLVPKPVVKLSDNW